MKAYIDREFNSRDPSKMDAPNNKHTHDSCQGNLVCLILKNFDVSSVDNKF